MEVGDVEAEEDEERKAREERAKRRGEWVKKEEDEVEQVEGVQMRKMEEESQEETQGKGDTARIDLSPKTLPVPLAPVQVEDFQKIQTGVDDAADIAAPSPITPGPLPSLLPSPMPTSSPLTLSQCFLPPSTPFTSPPPRSAPSPPASPPPPTDLPRLTRASKRLYINALEYVPASDSIEPTTLDDGKCTLASEASALGQPLSERRTSLNDKIPRTPFWCDFLMAPTRVLLFLASRVSVTVEPKPPARRAKKPAHRPVKTTIISPKPSKPSRKRSKTTRPPAAAPRTASRSSLSPTLSPARARTPADLEIDDPIPTPADLDRALYEGITFTRCVDISLSAVPYLFGLDACGFQFGGASNSGSLDSGAGVMDVSWDDAM
ncbi:hypothetical protein D9611_013143 [Ephemerocybe angulata]|uniref:Uncharacterized protein n=1 Tax=Ephemerocybe angulata TaxID=980116 RepID=A0A8H5FC79_9AGAR|nr:hypothetical protein D9611_013143 [Tulosesus angulatus]